MKQRKKKQLKYYRVNYEYVEYDEIYVKANSKEEAMRKADKKVWGEVADAYAEQITKDEYEVYK